MSLARGEIENLRKLEESLWRAKTRYDLNYMERILAPEFFEFSRSGRRYSREETLAVKVKPIRAALPLQAFDAHEISADMVLVTYISEGQYDEFERTNRSSLWRRVGESW